MVVPTAPASSLRARRQIQYVWDQVNALADNAGPGLDRATRGMSPGDPSAP
jgi:hypothetical protein